MNSWYCTDDDCMQYCKKNNERSFNFIEMVWLDVSKDDMHSDKEYTVKSAWIDLNDYSEHDMECAISGYYKNLQEVRETYHEEAKQIIAECIFEQMYGDCTTHGMMSKELAEEFIYNYISKE